MFAQPCNKAIVTIDGLIGGGKTELLKQLTALWAKPESEAIAVSVFEPVARWQETGTFGAMCASIGAIIKQREREAALASESEEDEQRSGAVKPTETGIPALFQMFAALSRTADFVQANKRATELALTNPDKLVIVLCERSIWTDCDVMCENLKRGGLMSAEHALFYDSAFIEIENIMCTVAGKAQADLALYLNTKVKTAMERVKTRDRADETKTVDESYQQCLDKLHHEIFDQDTYRGAPVMIVDGSQAFHTDMSIVSSIAADIVSRLTQHTTPSNSPALGSSPGTDSPPVLSRASSSVGAIVAMCDTQTAAPPASESEEQFGRCRAASLTPSSGRLGTMDADTAAICSIMAHI